MKRFLPLFAAGAIVFLSSCNNGSQETKPADSTMAVAAPVFAPFKIVSITFPVKDFAKWEIGYKSHDTARKKYGITDFVYGRGLEDSNMVIVINKIADVQKAKEFGASPDLKDAMKKAGVSGPPTTMYADVVRNDDKVIEQKDRLRVSHKVKDFAAWLKVFDADQPNRAGAGLIDRGLARNLEDSNMVSLVFAITDMAKAKAMVASPELKKKMEDGGVQGPPTFFFYKLVGMPPAK